MAQPDVDVAVVGAGPAGAAAAWALSRRGIGVALVDAREPGCPAGSPEVFRRTYDDRLYVRLTGRARELWQEAELDAGELLLRHTGGLAFGRRRSPRELGETLRAEGVPAALLSRREAGLRWPGIAFDGPVLFQPDAGVIDADRAVAAMIRCAVRASADWYPGTPVERLERVAGGVRLHLPGRSFLAGVAVLAAGTGLPALLDGLVDLPPLAVAERRVQRFAPREPGHAWPVFCYRDVRSGYGLPAGDGVAIGGDLDAEFVRRRLPGLAPVPYAGSTERYATAATGDVVVDRVGPLVVCLPEAAPGATLTPLVGELVAGVVTGTADVPPRFTLPAARRDLGHLRQL